MVSTELAPATAAASRSDSGKRSSSPSEGDARSRPLATDSASAPSRARPRESSATRDCGRSRPPASMKPSRARAPRRPRTSRRAPPRRRAATASSVCSRESGCASSDATCEKPRCTRACRARSAKTSAFRSASEARCANVSSSASWRSAKVPARSAQTPSTPADAAADDDRRVHHLREPRVRRARRRPLGLGEPAPQQRPPAGERLAHRPLGRDAAADLGGGQPVDGAAAEGAVVAVEDPAVGGVGADEPDGLRDEPLEDAVGVEVLGEHLGRVEQRRLLVEAVAVLREQPAGVDRQADLLRDGLEERDLVRRPAARLVAVGGEDPDRPVADDHRRRHGGPRAERDQVLAPLERLLRLEVVDHHRAPLGSGELGDRETIHGRGRVEPLAPPLAQHLGRAALVDEPHEAPVRVERRRRLRRGHVEHRGDVEVRAQALRERRQQPLPLERIRERRTRAEPLERDRGVRDKLAGQRDLLAAERARRGRRRDAQDADHRLLDDERDEQRAAGAADPLREAPARRRRGRDVEDAHGSGLEDGTRDARGLAVEVDDDVVPRQLAPVPRRRYATRDAPLDEDERGEVDVQQLARTVNQAASELADGACAGQLQREAHDRLPPPLRLRASLLRLAGTARAREEQLALAEAREVEDGRERADDRRGEREPAAAADRLAVDEDGHAHEHGGDPDRGEDQREGQLERADPAPLAPGGRRERHGREQVEAAHDEQRHRVQEDRLRLARQQHPWADHMEDSRILRGRALSRLKR